MSPEERSAAQVRLKSHPAPAYIKALNTYSITKDIFAMNGFEVRRFAEEIEAGKFSEIALNVNARSEYRDFENHLVRYFHNFLAAARTLIEHTRNMMNMGIISAAHRAEYEAEIAVVFSDDLSRFIGDFRNYILHRGIPYTNHMCYLLENKWSVVLDLEPLREWDGWKAPSKRFLDSHPKRMRIIWLVGSYENKVNQFHIWLVKSFVKYYGSLFEEHDALAAKLKASG